MGKIHKWRIPMSVRIPIYRHSQLDRSLCFAKDFSNNSVMETIRKMRFRSSFQSYFMETFCKFSIFIIIFWSTGCTTIKIESPRPSEVSLRSGSGIILKPDYGQESQNLAHAIAQEISANGFYHIVDRSNVRGMIEERNFQRMSSVENRNQGRTIRGADAILSVSARPDYSTTSDSSSFTYKDKTFTSYTSKTTVQYPVNFSVIDIHTSMHHVSKNLNLSDQKTRSSSDGYPAAPSPDEMLPGLRAKAVKQISNIIHPRIDRVGRTVAGTKNASTKTAIRLANSGMWQQALEYAQRGVKESPEDLGSLHALGIIYQGMGRYGQADKIFNDLVIRGGSKFSANLQDNKAMSQAALRYQQQVR